MRFYNRYLPFSQISFQKEAVDGTYSAPVSLLIENQMTGITP